MKNLPLLLIVLISISIHSCKVQPSDTDEIGIAFYNVENLFDTINDDKINDEEFLPESKLNWDTEKYNLKLEHISLVLSSLDSVDQPGIIGLCEIENRDVIEDLINTNYLKEFNYKIIHQNSPDFRGIDNAAIYRADLFELLEVKYIPVNFHFDSIYKTTRDILYFKGIALGKDTLHIMVNHWTSRWGGAEITEPKRVYIANMIRNISDSIMQNNPNANIIIMGDLNDNPTDKSLTEGLQALELSEEIDSNSLYNLGLKEFKEGRGTLYYKSWDVFDQMIVSGNLLDASGFEVVNHKQNIFKPDWVLYTDNKGIKRPSRTASGGRHYGGFSDHLAVSLKIQSK